MLRQMNPELFRAVLKNELWMRKITQIELDRKVGATPRIVNNWLRGRTVPPPYTIVGVMVLLRGEWDYE